MKHDYKEKNERGASAKEALSNFWKKTSDISKKAVEGAKELADQTKQNIYEAQAKKYTPITADELKDASFEMPSVVEIVNSSANRKFVTAEDSIGWIEQHEGVSVLHIYDTLIAKTNLVFVPLAQQDTIYCKDTFNCQKFIHANQVFEKANEEKLAELSNIAYCLGAKKCSVEIIEAETQTNSRSSQPSIKGLFGMSVSKTATTSTSQSGKRISSFEGHDNPEMPSLKWFANDDNIRSLIDMRLKKALKSTVLELKGSSSATMSRKLACAIDNVMNVKGKLSLEANAIREHSQILLFEIEF